MLEISGTTNATLPGQKPQRDVYTSLIVSAIKYNWIAWGFVADSPEELQQLKKIKFKVAPALPGLPQKAAVEGR